MTRRAAAGWAQNIGHVATPSLPGAFVVADRGIEAPSEGDLRAPVPR
jgi:hypothetical protein